MNAEAILNEKGNEVITIEESATIRDAACTLDQRRIGATVVVDGKGKVCGVLSERDITRQVAREGASALDSQVSTCMSSNVITAKRADTVDELLSCMTNRRIRHLPVMEAGTLVGVISIGDVVKRKIAETEAEADAMKAYIAAG